MPRPGPRSRKGRARVGNHAHPRQIDFAVAAQELLFLPVRRITHQALHEEAVNLGLGERIGPLLFDGILRGEHHEGRGENVRFLTDGDRPFLHRLQEGRLHLRRRAVHLVGEEDVGEDGPFAREKIELLRVVDTSADEVRREQVRGELDPVETRVDTAGEGAHGEVLARPAVLERSCPPEMNAMMILSTNRSCPMMIFRSLPLCARRRRPLPSRARVFLYFDVIHPFTLSAIAMWNARGNVLPPGA